MVHAAKGGVDFFPAVHLALIILEARGDGGRGLDRVHPGLHVAHMRWPAADRDPGPDHTDFGGIHRRQAGAGFGDDHRVGARQRQHGGERAIAGAFLLDHRLHLHLGRRLQARHAQRLERGDIGDDARLHVTGAAAIHPSVADRRLEGRRQPHVRRTLRHHIDMPLQRQAASARCARRVYGHDIVAPVIADQRRREAGVVFQRLRQHRHAAWRQAKAVIYTRHFVQRRVFVAERRGAAHQPRQRRDGVIAQRIHGLQNGAARAGIEGNRVVHANRFPRILRVDKARWRL